VKSTVETLPDSQVRLEVSLSADELKAVAAKVTRQLAGQANVPGFRKGKAPRAVLAKRYGATQIEHEILERALVESYYEAVKEHQLQPIGQPETKLPDSHHDLEKSGLSYTATVPVTPEVKLGDYSTVSVVPTVSSFKDELVDETIEQLRGSRAVTSPADRPAEAGDKVEIDFVGMRKGAEVPGAKSENHPLVIGEDNFVPGFSDQLVGLRAGQIKTFKQQFPKEYHDSTLAGAKVDFTVTMKSVQAVTLPELNDEFATGFGAGSMDELRHRLRENLQAEKDREARTATESAVVDAVVATAEAAIPKLLVDEELDRMLGEFRQGIERQGIPYDKYLEQLAQTEQQIRDQQRDEAARRVKTSLVLNELQRRENVAAGPEEIQAEIDQQLATTPDEQAKAQINSEEFRRYVARIIGNRKVVALLVARVTGGSKPATRLEQPLKPVT